MKTYTIYEAKTHFSELVNKAVAGEKVLIGAHGKATVELRVVTDAPKPKHLLGALEGELEVPEDFDRDDTLAKDIYEGIEEDD